MGFAGAAGDAQAQDLGDRLCRLDRAIDAMISELIGRQTLSVECAKTFFIAEERTAGHGHAAAEQDFRRRIKPEDRDVCDAKEFRAARLSVGAAAQS